MPNEEWGTKRLCPETGKRFYDMNKNPIISPYTGDVVEGDSGKSRVIAADAEDAATLKAKKEAEATEEVVLDDNDSNDDDETSVTDADLGDDVLDDDDDDDDTVSLDEIADVAAEEDET